MDADALIVGGGPAGAALAVHLARAGKMVILFEREPGPHDKVCGEFISHEAASDLAALGIDLPAHGAVAIHGVRLAGRGSATTEPLPFSAFSLSRRRLDEALLILAEQSGADVRRGAKVKGLTRTDGGWTAALDGGFVSGRDAVLATGKHDLRDRRRPPGLHNDLVGFKMHWRLAPDQAAELDGHVELSLFADGYGGLEPIEDGLANLCVLVRRETVRGGHNWATILELIRESCPSLDRRLQGGQPMWAKPLAIGAIPYGHVQTHNDGLWRLGDQAAVIPSFAGDGLAIALHSARTAASALLVSQDAATYQRALARDLRLQVKGAALLSHAMVRPWAQRMIVGLTRLRPQLLTAAARRTRISDKALARVLPRSRESSHEVTEGA
jgi:flavin-dependent dehydrogenase